MSPCVEGFFIPILQNNLETKTFYLFSSDVWSWASDDISPPQVITDVFTYSVILLNNKTLQLLRLPVEIWIKVSECFLSS